MTLTGTELFLLRVLIWTFGGALLVLLAEGVVRQLAKVLLFGLSWAALWFHDRNLKRIRRHYDSEPAI